MDEKALNELLECSVCLDRLDAQSKVLPCQHTFCRWCLEEIISTKKELRCPECRCLVEVDIQDLPANILLIRLLEGMKNVARIGGLSSRTSPSRMLMAGDRTGSVTSSPSHGHLDGTAHRTAAQKSTEITSQPCGKALYNYEATEAGNVQNLLPTASVSFDHRWKERNQSESFPWRIPNYGWTVKRENAFLEAFYKKASPDLSFKKGDVILLRKQVDENWYHGELKGQHGFFPATYIQVLTPLSSKEIPSCKALYDFQSDRNEQDCLIFQKDAVIIVIKRIDDNWLEGKLADRIGIFPVSFVELNDAAKMLINFQASLIKNGNNLPNDLNTQTRTSTVPSSSNMSASITSSTSSEPNASSSASSSEPPSPAGATITMVTSSSSTTTATQTPPHHQLMVARTHHKRHSLTTLTPATISAANHRHSMEISDTMFAASVSVSTATTSSLTTPCLVPVRTPEAIAAAANAAAASSGTTKSPGRIPQANSPRSHSSIYMSLYNYKPQKEDEIDLTKGEFYSVTEKCQDGWYKGQCLRTGKHGVFPGNYVQSVKSISKANGLNTSRSPSSITMATGTVMSTSAAVSMATSRQVTTTTSTSDVVRTRPSAVARTHSFPKTSPLASVEYQARLRSLGIRSTRLGGHPRPITNITQAQLRSHGLSNGSVLAQTTRAQSMVISSTDAPIMSTQQSVDDLQTKSPQHSLLPCPIRTSASDTTKTNSPRLTRRHTCSKYSHHGQRQGSTSNSSARHSAIPMVTTTTTNSAAVLSTNMNVTPPNVVIGATGGSPHHTTGGSPKHTPTKEKEKKKDKDRLPVSLMKKLSAGIPTRIKKSKSPNPDKQSSASAATTAEGAASSATSTPQRTASAATVSANHGASPAAAAAAAVKATSHHHRSGSAPTDASPGGATGTSLPVTQHKKSSSADNTHQGSALAKPSKVKPLARERFRCIAPYPPQSDSELELRVSDIVYVHRKRDDGWFKGTIQNSGRTGLFPGSFVEKC